MTNQQITLNEYQERSYLTRMYPDNVKIIYPAQPSQAIQLHRM